MLHVLIVFFISVAAWRWFHGILSLFLPAQTATITRLVVLLSGSMDMSANEKKKKIVKRSQALMLSDWKRQKRSDSRSCWSEPRILLLGRDGLEQRSSGGCLGRLSCSWTQRRVPTTQRSFHFLLPQFTAQTEPGNPAALYCRGDAAKHHQTPPAPGTVGSLLYDRTLQTQTGG